MEANILKHALHLFLNNDLDSAVHATLIHHIDKRVQPIHLDIDECVFSHICTCHCVVHSSHRKHAVIYYQIYYKT